MILNFYNGLLQIKKETGLCLIYEEMDSTRDSCHEVNFVIRTDKGKYKVEGFISHEALEQMTDDVIYEYFYQSALKRTKTL